MLMHVVIVYSLSFIRVLACTCMSYHLHIHNPKTEVNTEVDVYLYILHILLHVLAADML